jgi:hypothetical protein
VKIYTEAMDAITAKLEPLVSVCRDLRDANPPCVYLAPGSWTRQLAATDTEIVLWLLAPASGTAPAIDTLDALLETVAALVPVAGGDGAAVQSPGGGDPLPAIRTTLTIRVTPDTP